MTQHSKFINRKKQKHQKYPKVVFSISCPKLLFEAIEKLRGDVPRSVFITKQLMKTIDIEVKL